MSIDRNRVDINILKPQYSQGFMNFVNLVRKIFVFNPKCHLSFQQNLQKLDRGLF